MASLPSDRTKLALAQSNQNPLNVLGSSQNKNALTEAYDTIDTLYNYTTGLISAGTLSKLGIINVKDYNASGLATTAVGSITSGTKALTLTTTPDFVAGQGINLQGAFEASSLQVTAPATVSSNVTVTLNGVAFLVAVASGDTAIQVATKIRAATYAGWTAGGTAGTDTVTFTSLTSGVKTDATYSAGTTGATGTMTTTMQGTADQISTVSSVSGLVVNIADNATRTIAAGTMLHDDTVAVQAFFTALISGGVGIVPISTSYRLTSQISLTLNANARLTLIGFKSKFIDARTEPVSEAGLIKFVGDVVISGENWTGTNELSISGLEIIGSSAVLGNMDGFEISGMKKVDLKDLYVTGVSATGIHLESSSNLSIVNCKSNGNMYAGMQFDNCNGFVVMGGEYSSNGATIVTNGYGIAMSAGDAVNYNRNGLIMGVKANDNKRKGIDIHCGHNIKVISNFIKGFGNAGLYAVNESGGKDVKDITFADNDIIQTSTYSTYASYGINFGAYSTSTTDTGFFKIINNKIRDTNGTSQNAILFNLPNSVNAIDSVDISGNEVYNGSGSNTDIISMPSSGLLVQKMTVSNNILHSAACTNAINLPRCKDANIQGNLVTVDSGSCNGIVVIDTGTGHVLVSGNQLNGACTYTLPITPYPSTNLMWRGNVCQNISQPDSYKLGTTIDFGSAAPATGQWIKGSIRWNDINMIVGQPIGWRCTVSGTPGTWVAMANL